MRCSETGIPWNATRAIGPLHCAVAWRRSVTAAVGARHSATAEATRWSPRSGDSIRTSRRCGSSSARRRAACTSARAASRPARSPRRSRVAPPRCVSDPSLVRFRVALEGALAHLESRREEINDLNVFPVADGDTGDNMALTLQACLEEVDRLAAVDRPVDEIGRDEIVESVARAALLGARGNSGVILSQLIRGAAEELVSRPGELIDPVLLGAAMARAAQRAYASVRAPAEGTMLTVMRDMAAHVASRAGPHGRAAAGSGRRGRRAAARAGRHPRGGDRRRRGLGAPRSRAAARPARGRRRRRRRLRRDRHLRRRRGRPARRGGRPQLEHHAPAQGQPSRARVLDLSATARTSRSPAPSSTPRASSARWRGSATRCSSSATAAR